MRSFPSADGASYRARAERFCAGVPMNVTDVAVGPDGALYFTLGGRFSRGGVFRIVYDGPRTAGRGSGRPETAVDGLLRQAQPLAPWSRREAREALRKAPSMATELARIAAGNAGRSTRERIRAIDLLIEHGPAPEPGLLRAIAKDSDPVLRSHAIRAIGIAEDRDSAETLIGGLGDHDPLVRRRACEALIRAGIEPPIDLLWPVLGDSDRFVRTAARLVLARRRSGGLDRPPRPRAQRPDRPGGDRRTGPDRPGRGPRHVDFRPTCAGRAGRGPLALARAAAHVSACPDPHQGPPRVGRGPRRPLRKEVPASRPAGIEGAGDRLDRTEAIRRTDRPDSRPPAGCPAGQQRGPARSRSSISTA